MRPKEVKTVLQSPQISKEALPPKEVSKSIKFKDISAIKDAIQKVRDDNDETDWYYISIELIPLGCYLDMLMKNWMK